MPLTSGLQNVTLFKAALAQRFTNTPFSQHGLTGRINGVYSSQNLLFGTSSGQLRSYQPPQANDFANEVNPLGAGSVDAIGESITGDMTVFNQIRILIAGGPVGAAKIARSTGASASGVAWSAPVALAGNERIQWFGDNNPSGLTAAALGAAYVVCAVGDDNNLAGGNAVLYRSTNAGQTWAKIVLPAGIGTLTRVAGSKNLWLASALTGNVIYSTDNALTWSAYPAATVGIPSVQTTGVCVCANPNQAYFLAGDGTAPDSRLIRSFDLVNWAQCRNIATLPGQPGIGVADIKNAVNHAGLDIVLRVTPFGMPQIIWSVDSITWIVAGSFPQALDASVMFPGGNFLVAFGSNRILRRNIQTGSQPYWVFSVAGVDIEGSGNGMLMETGPSPDPEVYFP